MIFTAIFFSKFVNMKTCTIFTILFVCTSFRVETKNLSSRVKKNPLTINGENKKYEANLERTLAELSDKIKSLEDEINLSKNQTMPQERGLHATAVLPFV